MQSQIALRPTTRPKRIRPRSVLHETEAETKTNYCETETETKKVVLRPRLYRYLNIPVSKRHLRKPFEFVPH